jgi:hypothetical protein
MLQDFKVLHVNREGNRVADALAKRARSGASVIYDSSLPPEIRELVTLDCNNTLNHFI